LVCIALPDKMGLNKYNVNEFRVLTETGANHTTLIIKTLKTETIEIWFGRRFRDFRKEPNEYL